ncbi:MAG TPA: hypothetical protein VJI98_03365 [Candidatus Nanoarchaeia archaeon]|nr:hypothetical protein [Candidatus Nanoarchaeia archaeon]
MKMWVILVITIFLVSCTSQVQSNKQCAVDNECVPAVCCHAKDTVNQANAPDCSAILCSLECEPGTLDCGQGGLACVEGACTVVLYDQ